MHLAGRIAWPAAILGPSVVALGLVPLRDHVDPTNVALILVVVVVGVAALGRRLPGLVASVIAGLAFDYLWTKPYRTLSIYDSSLIQTTILLVVVGAVVSELARIGQAARQQSAQNRGYLAGAVDVLATFDRRADPSAQVRLVERRVAEILGADNCRYQPGPSPTDETAATLAPDGSLQIGGHRADVDRAGLPTDRITAIPVVGGGHDLGFLSVTAASRWTRPTAEQRQAAVLMANQLGEMLARTGQSAP